MESTPERGHLVEQPKRNPEMAAWGDAVQEHTDLYLHAHVDDLLTNIAGQVAQGSSQSAQKAIAQLGLYVRRLPVVLASEVTQAQSVDDVTSASNDAHTNNLISSVEYYAPWVDRDTTSQLRRRLSNEALVTNVLIPAGQAAGLA